MGDPAGLYSNSERMFGTAKAVDRSGSLLYNGDFQDKTIFILWHWLRRSMHALHTHAAW